MSRPECWDGPDWWEGIAPLEVPAPEGAGGHRLVWREARLELADHPDPEAERAVVALGGDRCPCLDVLDAWDACHRTGSVLIAGRRHRTDSLVPPLEASRRLTDDLRHWRRAVALVAGEARAAGDAAMLNRLAVLVGPAERAAAERLGFLLLLGLDQRLGDRLAASVAASLARAGRCDALEAATAARALPPLRAMGWTGAADDISLGPDGAFDADRVVLAPRWLAAVWGRGVAGAVPGHLVVDVLAVRADRSLEVVIASPGKGSFAASVDQWENESPHTSTGAT